MSKKIRQQYGTQIGSAVLGQVVGSNVASIASQVAQQGFSFANLKYSRDNETEADHMGLIFAAMAGYDPQVAISFWQRMSSGSSSNKSDILSDHPSDAKRIAALQKEMPEALKYYQAASKATSTTTAKKTTTKSTTTKKSASTTKKTTTAKKKTSK